MLIETHRNCKYSKSILKALLLVHAQSALFLVTFILYHCIKGESLHVWSCHAASGAITGKHLNLEQRGILRKSFLVSSENVL